MNEVLFFFSFEFLTFLKARTLMKKTAVSPVHLKMDSLALKNWWVIAGAVQDSFLLSEQNGKF